MAFLVLMLVVADLLVNGFLLLVVGGSYMHTCCIHRHQHPKLKSD